MTKQEFIAKWKQHALDNYDQGGWDVVVECWDGEEWADLVKDINDTGLELDEDFEAAERLLKQLVDVWADRQADARQYRE